MFKIYQNDKEILDAFRNSLPQSVSNDLAFFSSQINGFITDPAFMTVHIQDKIIHRSYAVFETAKIFGNKIFQLDKHIDRFFSSLEILNLSISLYSKDEIKLILQKLAAVARKIEPNSDIDMRFFYSAGLGNYSLKVDNHYHTFYAVAVRTDNSVRPIDGVNETLYDVNTLRDKVSNAKTTNYLVNSIITSKASDDNGYLGIVTDEHGNILEGVMSNVAFVLEGDIFSLPSFEKTLPGTTAIKVLDLVDKDLIPNKKLCSISRDYITMEDVKSGKVKEAMLVGGDFVIPILKLNGIDISPIPGKITRYCQEYMRNLKFDEEVRNCEKIPYFDDI